jgi:membrane-associated phospholipid phosphatase
MTPELKPLIASRTLWGTALTVFGMVALEASNWLATMVPMLTPLASNETTRTVLFFVSLAGAALVIYARVDDRLRGLK